MEEIKNYETFKTIEKINKGWSNDKKYFVETCFGEQLLLRIADVSMHNDKNTSSR